MEAVASIRCNSDSDIINRDREESEARAKSEAEIKEKADKTRKAR